jgi:hypothetical protein
LKEYEKRKGKGEMTIKEERMRSNVHMAFF